MSSDRDALWDSEYAIHAKTFRKLPLDDSERVSGEVCRTVFSQSKLPPADLSKIWILVDVEKRGSLTQAQFISAMFIITDALRGGKIPSALPIRLKSVIDQEPERRNNEKEVTMHQHSLSNGHKSEEECADRKHSGSYEVATNQSKNACTGSLAIVTDNGTNSLNQQPLENQRFSPNEFPSVPDNLKKTYRQMFAKRDTDKDGLLSSSTVHKMLKKAALPQKVMVKIWRLSDVNQDGKLDVGEFIVAMHLCAVARTSTLELPDQLPGHLLTVIEQERPGQQAADIVRLAEEKARERASASLQQNNTTKLDVNQSGEKNATTIIKREEQKADPPTIPIRPSLDELSQQEELQVETTVLHASALQGQNDLEPRNDTVFQQYLVEKDFSKQCGSPTASRDDTNGTIRNECNTLGRDRSNSPTVVSDNLKQSCYSPPIPVRPKKLQDEAITETESFVEAISSRELNLKSNLYSSTSATQSKRRINVTFSQKNDVAYTYAKDEYERGEDVDVERNFIESEIEAQQEQLKNEREEFEREMASIRDEEEARRKQTGERVISFDTMLYEDIDIDDYQSDTQEEHANEYKMYLSDSSSSNEKEVGDHYDVGLIKSNIPTEYTKPATQNFMLEDSVSGESKSDLQTTLESSDTNSTAFNNAENATPNAQETAEENSAHHEAEHDNSSEHAQEPTFHSVNNFNKADSSQIASDHDTIISQQDDAAKIGQHAALSISEERDSSPNSSKLSTISKEEKDNKFEVARDTSISEHDQDSKTNISLIQEAVNVSVSLSGESSKEELIKEATSNQTKASYSTHIDTGTRSQSLGFVQSPPIMQKSASTPVFILPPVKNREQEPLSRMSLDLTAMQADLQARIAREEADRKRALEEKRRQREERKRQRKANRKSQQDTSNSTSSMSRDKISIRHEASDCDATSFYQNDKMYLEQPTTKQPADVSSPQSSVGEDAHKLREVIIPETSGIDAVSSQVPSSPSAVKSTNRPKTPLEARNAIRSRYRPGALDSSFPPQASSTQETNAKIEDFEVNSSPKENVNLETGTDSLTENSTTRVEKLASDSVSDADVNASVERIAILTPSEKVAAATWQVQRETEWNERQVTSQQPLQEELAQISSEETDVVSFEQLLKQRRTQMENAELKKESTSETSQPESVCNKELLRNLIPRSQEENNLELRGDDGRHKNLVPIASLSLSTSKENAQETDSSLKTENSKLQQELIDTTETSNKNKKNSLAKIPVSQIAGDQPCFAKTQHVSGSSSTVPPAKEATYTDTVEEKHTKTTSTHVEGLIEPDKELHPGNKSRDPSKQSLSESSAKPADISPTLSSPSWSSMPQWKIDLLARKAAKAKASISPPQQLSESTSMKDAKVKDQGTGSISSSLQNSPYTLQNPAAVSCEQAIPSILYKPTLTSSDGEALPSALSHNRSRVNEVDASSEAESKIPREESTCKIKMREAALEREREAQAAAEATVLSGGLDLQSRLAIFGGGRGSEMSVRNPAKVVSPTANSTNATQPITARNSGVPRKGFHIIPSTSPTKDDHKEQPSPVSAKWKSALNRTRAQDKTVPREQNPQLQEKHEPPVQHQQIQQSTKQSKKDSANQTERSSPWGTIMDRLRVFGQTTTKPRRSSDTSTSSEVQSSAQAPSSLGGTGVSGLAAKFGGNKTTSAASTPRARFSTIVSLAQKQHQQQQPEKLSYKNSNRKKEQQQQQQQQQPWLRRSPNKPKFSTVVLPNPQ